MTDTAALIAETRALAEKAQALSLPGLESAGSLAEEALAQGALSAPKLPPEAKPGYDHVIDALNRLPRPLAAIGALVLVAYAMIDPAGFAARMAALADMPEPLWWLIGAVLTFTFGAREAHYLRNRPAAPPETPAQAPQSTVA